MSGSQAGVVAQERVQQLVRALGRQRIEPELRVVGLAAPAVLILGPVVDEQQEPRRRQALDQAVEQGLRLGVDPVQVLEDHQQRLDLALPQQQALHGVERALPALGGIEALPTRVLDGHIEQRQQGGQDRLAGVSVQRQELARSPSRGSCAASSRSCDLEVGLEEIDDRQVAVALP